MALKIVQVGFADMKADPRIRRSVDALVGDGYDVTSVGYGNGVTHRPMTLRGKLKRTLRQGPAWVFPRQKILDLYWQSPEVQELYKVLSSRNADLIHAHDVEALPAAARAAGETGAKLIYDSHEHAASMRSERLLWHLVFARFLKTIEADAIHKAEAVVTVGPTLAQELRETYGLRRAPCVVRNIPAYQPISFRPTNREKILLHYHGVLNSGRGLKTLVLALQYLPGAFHLRITGPERQPGFERTLKGFAQRCGVASRVHIQSAVAPEEVVAHASEADIGLFVVGCQTVQQTCALPNKIFEYTMAGLMVCAGTAPDVTGLIRKHRLGVALKTTNPRALANEIGALTPDRIDAYKRSNLQTATDLCWEQEKAALLSLYAELCASA